MRQRLRKQGGYLIGADPAYSAPVETDTVTCSHCGNLYTVKPLIDPVESGGGCYVCDGLICRKCVEAGHRGEKCTPWEERMNRMEAAYNFRRDAGLND